MNDKVDIILASYKGGLYIREQILSILNQTYPHLHIWVRDDLSPDNTVSVVQELQQEYPDRITLLTSTERLGVKGNFAELMRHSTAHYVMFSDQDDKWLPNKVELTLGQMKKMENRYGKDIPYLVHTDLAVVNADLSEISPSLWKYSHLKPECCSLNRLLVQNVITGCTMLINRPLLNLSLPIANQAIMHDWWIALTAAAFGHIGYVKTPTMLYRQHGNNDVGAKKHSIWKELKVLQRELERLILFFRPRKPTPKPTYPNYDQARAFLEYYDAKLSHYHKQMVLAFLDLPQMPYFKQKKTMLRFRFFRNSNLANCYLMVKVMPR